MKTSTAIRNLQKCKHKEKHVDKSLHRDLGHIFNEARNDRESYLGTGFQEEPQVCPPPMLHPLF